MSEETNLEELRRGTELVKRGFTQMQKGDAIMDVVNAEQTKIAEEAGAVAVMALEAVPADIRKHGGVPRMADPETVTEIIDAVSIPVIEKARIGYHTEAQILESIGMDMIDESEVLTPAGNDYRIDKREFTSPFICGARNLPEALRRIDEGAAMIRTRGEAGTGDVNQAVTHQHTIKHQIRSLTDLNFDEREKWAREHEAPAELVHETAEMGRLPVVNFAAGGVAMPTDATLMMYHECDNIFVGSGIFGAEDPERMGEAIVETVNNWNDPDTLADIAAGIGKGMESEANVDMADEDKLQGRGVQRDGIRQPPTG